MDKRDSNVEYMTEYLKHAIEFEKYVYVWTEALNAAQKRFDTVYNDRKKQAFIRNDMSSKLASLDSVYSNRKAEEQKKYDESNSQKNKALAALLIGILGILCIVPIALLSDDIEKVGPIMGSIACVALWCIIIASICYGSAKKKVVKAKEVLESLNGGAAKKWDTQYLTMNRSEADRSYSIAESELNKLSVQIKSIKEGLAIAEHDRAKLYSENVLPMRYRTFNAVATLYQYLETKRCNVIVGHGGIYDAYETDLLQKVIIENLVGINNRLARIEANQHRLYYAIQDANHMLGDICSSLNTIERSVGKIQRNSEETANNTAISAVAAQQTAAAVQYRNWLDRANGNI